MNRTDLEILRQVPLFAGLDEGCLSDLLEGATVRVRSKGQLLFQQGDEADCFYVVLSGWVKIFRLTPDGEQSIMGLFTRGETFAEAAMFIGGHFPANAEVIETARLLRIPSEPFQKRLHSEPGIAVNMLASVSRRVHYLVGQIEQLQVRSGTQRVADFLLRLCPVDDGSAVVALPYDKSLIASRLGMKPESFSRALARLREVGVQTGRNHVSVTDVAALAEFCEGKSVRPPHLTRSCGRS
ncbi:MAG: Crp/Fnr family transcriptional regulator [Gammaproteobacteria bacterium]|nr:Crp/Fnr family transcriptional regulator [Gammaproteobacteria bacterium]